jgi:hypothetical protein
MQNFLQKFWRQYQTEIVVAAITFLAASLLYGITALRFPNDDQFILYRYIDNIAAGNGFVYNIGERVLGSTTPLFTLLCAVVKAILPGLFTPTLVAYVNIVFFTLAGIFFYRVCRHFLSEKFSLFALLIFVLNLSRVIPEGMETPLFMFGAMAFLDFLFQKKYYTSSIFLAVTILTRPDAGLIAVLALIYWLHTVGIKKTTKLVGLCFAIGLPWLIFSVLYFGSFIPQSLQTKIHSNDIVHQSSIQAFKVELSALSRIYWGKLFDPEHIPLQSLINLLPFLVLVGIAVRKKLNKETWILFAIPVVYLISYSVSNPVMFPWYISQIEPFWILISIIGFTSVYRAATNKNLKLILMLLLLIGPAVYYTKVTTTNDPGSKQALFKMGTYVKDNMEPGDKVGISNIGIVSFITNAYIVDFIGLTNRYSVHYYPIESDCLDRNQQYVIPPKLIQDTMPDWVLAGEGEMRDCFYQSTAFTSQYKKAYSVGKAHVWKLEK